MPTAQQVAAFREVLAALTGQAVDDLAAVDGISRELAEEIYRALH